MDSLHQIYSKDPISKSKLQFPQNKNKWISVTFDKTRSNLWQPENFIYLKGKSTLTIKNILNSICTESFLWNVLITYSIWLNFILVSYIYIFMQPKSMDSNMFRIISLLDLLFILDMIRSTAIFFGHQKLGRRNSDRRHAFFAYLDIYLALPIDYFIYYFYAYLQSAWFITFRLTSIIRAYRILTFFYQNSEAIGFHHTIMGIIKFLSMFSLVIHALTCVWYGNNVSIFAKEVGHNSHHEFIADDYYNASRYTFSTVASFGCGFITLDTLVEKFLSCTAMIFGYFLCAVVLVPTIWNWFYLNHIKGITLCNKEQYILNYLQSINCVELMPEISKYYKMFWKKKRGINNPEMLNALNFALEDDVQFDQNYKFLKGSIIFHEFSENYLRRISYSMKHEFYNIGDYIFKQNCVKDKMVCVVKGVIDVLSAEDSNSPVISFGTGTCIAECALILRMISKTAVKAATYVELQVIYREDFYKTISHYPKQYDAILKQIHQRILLAQEKLLSVSGLSMNIREGSFIEMLKGKSPTKTRINLSQDCVHYKPVEKTKYIYRSKLNFAWLIIISICAIYVAIAYPYYICFKKSYSNVIGCICEILFIVDVFVSIFKQGFKETRNVIIWKTSSALKCLDSPYFYLDVFSAFPFEIFTLALPIDPKDDSKFSFIKVCLIVKLNRLFKVYKIHLLLKLLVSKFRVNICFVKIAETLIVYILTIYWTASFLYFFACYNYTCVENRWFANKIAQENRDKLQEPLTRNPFALSMYFSSCVLLGIEIGDVVPSSKLETIFVGILIILGIMLRGCILAIFIGAINLAQTSKLVYQSKLYSVLSVTQKYFFPEKLKQRLMHFYALQSLYNKDITNEGLDAIDELPKNLEKDIRIAEALHALESVKFFSYFDDEFLKWVAYNAKLLILPPKEVVLYQGSTTRALYILQKGYCYEKYAGKSNYKTHGPYNVFGYNSFLFSIPEQSQVTALSHCQLVLVDYEIFKMADIEFPHVMEQMRLGIRNSLAGGDVNYDIKMLEYTLDRCDINVMNKFDRKVKNFYSLNEVSFTNMKKYCRDRREDYFHPFLKLGNYKWFKFLLMSFTINPHGAFFQIWTFIRLAIAFAYGILGPIQYIVAPYHPTLHLFLSMLDCLTYIDLYLRFHVAYYDTYGQVVRHPYSTARAYFKGPFYLDLAICFPIEWCLFVVWGSVHNDGLDGESHNATLGMHPIHCGLRLIRILQLYRFILFVRYCEQELTLKRYVLAIFTYLSACVLLINAWTCALIALNCKYSNKGNGFEDDLNTVFMCHEESWYSRSRYGKKSNLSDVYNAAFYFVTSVSMSVGFGDLSPKRFDTLNLIILMIILNWIIITYLVAKIIASSKYSSVEQENYKKMLIFQSKLKEIAIYLRNNNISLEEQRELANYLHYIWNRSNGTQNLTALLQVNDSLLQDCISFLYEDIMKKVPLFRRMGRAFYRQIAQELKEIYFLKGQYIIRSQDVVDEIYIVKNGKVDFFVTDGVLQFTMGCGAIFGNFTQNNMTIFSGTIIANTNVDLLVLKSEEFEIILNTRPLFKKKLEAVMDDDREYYASVDVNLIDKEITKKKRKYIPIFIYHSKFQNALLMKVHLKNWLDFVFAFTAYLNCLLIIYQFSFQDFSVKYVLASVLIDVIFIFKMCLAFNRPILDRFGESIKDLQNNYFSRKLNRSLDIFINLSSVTSYLIFYLPSHSLATAGFTIWRLICLLRIYYLFAFFRKKSKDVLANKLVVIFWSVLLWLSLIVHTCACIWYIIVCPMASCPSDLWASITNTTEPFEMYITSVYFIICIFTSTGRGDILPRNTFEMGFIVALILFANITNAIILAEIANGIYMECRIRYEQEINNIKCYLKRRQLRKYQVNKVVQYLTNFWKYSHGYKIPRIISELPISIRADLLWNIYGPTLKESYIFSKTEKSFLRHLVLLLEIQIYFQNDYIIRDSTIDERIYFIYKGEVSIVTHYSNQTDIVHDTLHTGDVFGLGQGLFPAVPHHFSFKANTATEILSLKLEKWKRLLDLFPTSKVIIYDRIENVYI